MMKNKTSKWRFYFTIDREEKFLNEMCAKGWKPTKIIFGALFKFERCEPNEYIARVACTKETNGKTDEKLKFMTEALVESGAEIIPETFNLDTNSRIYSVRKASLGEFEINTDKESLIADYISRRRMHMTMLGILVALSALLTVVGILCIFFGLPEVANMEFLGAVIELILSISALAPIFKYNKHIRKLRSEQKFSE